MEYDLFEGERCTASAINRFRNSWYDVHLTHSSWRVTETTKSVHSHLKTPGSFAVARAVTKLPPAIIEEAQLKCQQSSQKVSVQALVRDRDMPSQLRTAIRSLHQATANLLGSHGHRRQLRGEGEAYTLRFGGLEVNISQEWPRGEAERAKGRGAGGREVEGWVGR